MYIYCFYMYCCVAVHINTYTYVAMNPSYCKYKFCNKNNILPNCNALFVYGRLYSYSTSLLHKELVQFPVPILRVHTSLQLEQNAP